MPFVRTATISFLALASICAAALQGCEARMPNKDATSDRTETAQPLHGGMAIMEVEDALGCEGKPMEWSRRIEQRSPDSMDWNAEWRLEYRYEIDTETDVIAVYEAWTPEESMTNPPESAYRLVSWKSGQLPNSQSKRHEALR